MKSTLLLFLIPFLVDLSPTAAPAYKWPLANACTTIDGKPRPYPCEFEILTLWLLGKNGEVLGKLTPDAKQIVLPASKAINSSQNPAGGSLFYNVSVDFRRIHMSAFTTPTYTLSRASITDPISPGETTAINSGIKVSPGLPPAGIRPNRVMFQLQLNYAKGDMALVAPPRLVLLENPVTFEKTPKAINHYRDRAEAWIDFMISVDFKK